MSLYYTQLNLLAITDLNSQLLKRVNVFQVGSQIKTFSTALKKYYLGLPEILNYECERVCANTLEDEYRSNVYDEDSTKQFFFALGEPEISSKCDHQDEIMEGKLSQQTTMDTEVLRKSSHMSLKS